jgi:hypothetical protein
MARPRDKFRLTKAQARGLAQAVRACSWVAGEAGDHTVTVAHHDGTEVTITVNAPRPVAPKVIRGFVP